MNPVSVVTPTVANGGSQSSQAQFSQSTAVTLSSQWQDANSFSVTIDLSQDAKASLARANNNQVAANRILAFVDASRAGRSSEPGANSSWSDGQPSIEQEYQQLTGNDSQISDNPQAAPGGAVTVTLSVYRAASVRVESGNATTTANVASAQYDSVSLSVASSTGSVDIVQSDQSQAQAAAQIGSASPLSITA
jgi:hypothetical protein